MYQFPLQSDQVLQYRSEITSYAAARAMTTVGLQTPVCFEFAVGNGEQWLLRKRAGGESDDAASYLVPTDYNASTNNVIFVRQF